MTSGALWTIAALGAASIGLFVLPAATLLTALAMHAHDPALPKRGALAAALVGIAIVILALLLFAKR